MPLQRCERDGSQGWQWGEEGKCYTEAEEGSMEDAKQKAIDQAIAIGEAAELATIKDVPVLKAGTHRSRNAGDVVITETEIDNIIEGSNELRELIKESMSTGAYRGNNIKADFVPGPLNLHHNDFLDETMKERTKNVNWTFGKANVDGQVWLTETFENVPHDVAKAIKTHFPFRSVEILPLVHPETGKQYDKVIRSTAFLDRFTPAAVKGQNENITVEFAEGESPVMTLISSVEPTTQTEVEEMADTKQAMPETGKPEVDVNSLTGALSEKDKKIAELQAEQAAKEARLAELEAARNEDAKILAELQAARDESEVKEFMATFEGQILNDEKGMKYQVAPAFSKMIKELIAGTKRSDVIEMSEGKKPLRSALQAFVQNIVEMEAQGGILACLSEIGSTPNTSPDSKPKPILEMALEIQNEEGISYQAALNKAQGGK
jgi:hypothetical protein